MDYRKLLEKYNTLLKQVDRLTKENIQLKSQLGLSESEPIAKTSPVKNTGRKTPDDELAQKNFFSGVSCTSDSLSKVRLFMSLFKGREDVYAKRWENKKSEPTGHDAHLFINTNLRASDLLRLKVGQVKDLKAGDTVEIKVRIPVKSAM